MSRMVTFNEMCGIREDAMVSPKILVARSEHLSDPRAWIVGSPSRTQSSNNDGLPHGPNATRASADRVNTLGGAF